MKLFQEGLACLGFCGKDRAGRRGAAGVEAAGTSRTAGVEARHGASGGGSMEERLQSDRRLSTLRPKQQTAHTEGCLPSLLILAVHTAAAYP
jgi:hypothetical protein